MSKLYIIPTPIGNLKDITIRAIEVLKEVDLILAEDTRKSIKLLSHFDIITPMSSYHQHNEHKKLDSIIHKLKSGKTLALISDAGTPSISDPGFLLVRECVKNKINFDNLKREIYEIVKNVDMSHYPKNDYLYPEYFSK